MEILTVIWSFIVTNLVAIIGVAGGAAVLGLILGKLIPKEKWVGWGDKAESSGAWVGKIITDGAAQLPYIGKIWNKVLEPYLILLVNNVLVRFVLGIVGRKGLLSDNPVK